jgi:magnesium transporter
LCPDILAAKAALESAEERLFDATSSRGKIEDLYVLKRRLMTLKHAVLPLLDDVGKLQGGRVHPVCAGTREYFRDVYDHLMRINSAIESIREMLATAISVTALDRHIRRRDHSRLRLGRASSPCRR